MKFANSDMFDLEHNKYFVLDKTRVSINDSLPRLYLCFSYFTRKSFNLSDLKLSK